MEKFLYIMEKPSAGQAAIKALGAKEGVWNGEQFAIVNLRGHILEYGKPDQLAYENKKEIVGGFTKVDSIPWSVDYFDFDKMQPIHRKSRDGKIDDFPVKTLKIIQGYLKAGYKPVISSDHDESGEGDAVVHNVLKFLNYNGPMYREYHIDEAPNYLREAFASKKLVTRQDPTYVMAHARSVMDYMTMQGVRVATNKLLDAGYDAGRPIPFGRVQGYPIKKVGDQLNAIANYKPSSVFESRYKLDNITLICEGIDQFETLDKWDSQGLPSKSKVKEVKTQPGTIPPPKPLTYTEINELMVSQGYKLSDIESITQSMYENQVITYPRTPDTTIKPAQFDEFLSNKDLFIGLLGLPKAIFTHLEPRYGTHVHEQGSHGGLRPGVNIPGDLNELDTLYGKGAAEIYKLITNRALMMLLEDTEFVRHYYETVDTGDRVFKCEIRVITKQGVINPDDDTSDIVNVLPDLSKLAELYAHEVKSKAPKKPTTAWLLNDMKRNDIGTDATRPKIVKDLIGLTEAHPLKDGKVLDLSLVGQIAYEYVKDSWLASKDGTVYIYSLMKQVFAGKMTPEEAYSKFLTYLNDDLERMSNLPINFEKLKIPKIKQKDIVEGVFKGKTVRFNGVYGDHTFTPDERASLLNGESITIVVNGKFGKSALTGELGDIEFKDGRKGFGFKILDRKVDGRVYGEWKGRSINYKGSFLDHVFTEDENKRLLNGESIEFKATKDGRELDIIGTIVEELYEGKVIHKVSAKFKPNPNIVKGIWNGVEISFNKMFMGEAFTDSELKMLFDGQEVSVVREKNGAKQTISGSIIKDVYKGRDVYKFNPKFPKREGYITCVWNGKEMSYKGEFMKHVFTDNENDLLIQGKKIVFTGTTKTGKSMTVGGGLGINLYQGREYLTFIPDFDNSTKNDKKGF